MINTVTIESIRAKIISTNYIVVPGTTLTICVITLANGYVVTGESACVDSSNFNEKMGREIANQKAFDKIWALEGYLLAQRIYGRSKYIKDKQNEAKQKPENTAST